jgi:5-methylcytosine-specific restriction endonuclease McrA
VTAVQIPIQLRKLVLARFEGRCAFCRCAEDLMGVTFEMDHLTPRATGGTTTLDNLCLCCPTWNRHKAAVVTMASGRRLPARDPDAHAVAETAALLRDLAASPRRSRCSIHRDAQLVKLCAYA